MTMNTLETIRESLPETAKDIKLNLQSLLDGPGALSPAQRWGVAVAVAIVSRQTALRDAVIAAAREAVGPAVVEDAQAAAALMAMNNVYYRFRHMVPAYADKPARLRMNRILRPATNKPDFELFSLAVSAVQGCPSCVRSHEKAVLEGGLTEEHVHDAVRLAATVFATAVSMELGAAA